MPLNNTVLVLNIEFILINEFIKIRNNVIRDNYNFKNMVLDCIKYKPLNYS